MTGGELLERAAYTLGAATLVWAAIRSTWAKARPLTGWLYRQFRRWWDRELSDRVEALEDDVALLDTRVDDHLTGHH